MRKGKDELDIEIAKYHKLRSGIRFDTQPYAIRWSRNSPEEALDRVDKAHEALVRLLEVAEGDEEKAQRLRAAGIHSNALTKLLKHKEDIRLFREVVYDPTVLSLLENGLQRANPPSKVIQVLAEEGQVVATWEEFLALCGDMRRSEAQTELRRDLVVLCEDRWASWEWNGEEWDGEYAWVWHDIPKAHKNHGKLLNLKG